jgi:hypothetical protein
LVVVAAFRGPPPLPRWLVYDLNPLVTRRIFMACFPKQE